MFHIGTHVKVNAGEYHGKRGEVTAISLVGSGLHKRAQLTVTLGVGLTVSGYGPDFTPVLRAKESP